MRGMFAAVAFAALMTGAAIAQETPPAPEAPAAAPEAPAAPAAPVPPSACAQTPQPPTRPDPATADAASMQAANEAYQAWAKEAQAALDCRRTEVSDLRSQFETIRDQANARVAEFNAMSAALSQESEAWVAAVTAYNERQGGNRRRPRR